ncbi:hypothetical protein BJ944DRAFT_230334 [Cunninghamella echinulata]|nr:hypothetical protein BJ944DRAFT_230334 [Cunninghamella echinulata]
MHGNTYYISIIIELMDPLDSIEGVIRTGHAATLTVNGPDSNLLLLCGDVFIGSDEIHTLQDTYYVYNIITTSRSATTELSNNLPSEKLIPIVVCVSVVVIVALIYYIRYKKHKEKNAFIFADFRKNEFNDITSQGSLTGYENAIVKLYDGIESITMVDGQNENLPIPLKKITNKDLLPLQDGNCEKIKPSELYITYFKGRGRFKNLGIKNRKKQYDQLSGGIKVS